MTIPNKTRQPWPWQNRKWSYSNHPFLGAISFRECKNALKNVFFRIGFWKFALVLEAVFLGSFFFECSLFGQWNMAKLARLLFKLSLPCECNMRYFFWKLYKSFFAVKQKGSENLSFLCNWDFSTFEGQIFSISPECHKILLLVFVFQIWVFPKIGVPLNHQF